MRFIIFLILLCGCADSDSKRILYPDQIGDTIFDAELDDPNFQFCNAEQVLHKRNLIKYQNGTKGLEKDIRKKYIAKQEFQAFSGYIIVRFAINCNNQIGRLRLEILDNNFKSTSAPDGLETHIRDSFSSLNAWQHPVYKDQDYDGYSFYTLKFTNGKLELI